MGGNSGETAPPLQITDYLPLLQRLAYRVTKCRPTTMEAADLMQEGVIGLMDAIAKWDPTKGLNFRSYAYLRVRGAMIDALRHAAWPRGIRQTQRSLDAGEAITPLQQRRLSVAQHVSGLPEQDGAKLPDGFMPRPTEAPDAAVMRHDVARCVRQAITTLPPRLRMVICRYYFEGWSLHEIGQHFGVNDSRACQLHRDALRRLHAVMEHP